MSIVKDMSLAESGRRKIQWVRDFMPALSQIEARFLREKPFQGLRVAVSVHLEAKTANLGYVLKQGGAVHSAPPVRYYSMQNYTPLYPRNQGYNGV